jgi:hypothetical protein
MESCEDVISNLCRKNNKPFHAKYKYSSGPNREKVTEMYRKLHHEQLHDLYSSPTFVRVIKSRRMRWAGHVAWIGGERHVQGFSGET